MGGFLGALAPIGQTLSGQFQLGEMKQQQAANRAAFGKALDQLGPEYDFARQMYGAGASPEAVLGILHGPIGEDLRAQHQGQQLQQILGDPTLSQTDKAVHIAGLTGKPDYYEKLQELALKPQSSTPEQKADALRMLANNRSLPEPEREQMLQAADSGNPAAMDFMLNKSGLAQMMKPDVKTEPDFDLTSGFQRNYRIARDAAGHVLWKEPAGIKFSAQQQTELSGAFEALQAVPEAIGDAQAVKAKLSGMSAGQQRDYIQNQWTRYNAAREADKYEPYDPRRHYYTSYGPVDPTMNTYFTMMGQIQQQMAAPMHIFRSLGMFQAIAPHIPVANDLPDTNLERLKRAQIRWSTEFQRIRGMQEGTVPFPGAASGGGAPAAPSDWTDIPG